MRLLAAGAGRTSRRQREPGKGARVAAERWLRLNKIMRRADVTAE